MSNIELLEEKAGWEVEEWIDEAVARELSARRKVVDPNCFGAGAYDGATQALLELKEWLRGEEE